MMLSMATFSPKNHRTPGLGATALSAAKIVFLAIGVASTVVLTARTAYPYFLSLPKIRSFAFSWLAPPYLFILVHFIIMVIWKLHKTQNPDEQYPPCNNNGNDSLVDASVIDSIPESEEPSPPPEAVRDVMTEADYNNRSNEQLPWPPPTPPPPIETETETEPPEDIQEDTNYYSPSTGPDSIDATWRAIMESKSSPDQNQLTKSDTWEKPSQVTFKPSPPLLTRAVPVDSKELRKSDTFREKTDTNTVIDKREMRKSKTFRESTSASGTTTGVAARGGGWRRRDALVVGHDELFRKVEAFIKMNYDQMRLKRQESAAQQHRRVEMVNAAY